MLAAINTRNSLIPPSFEAAGREEPSRPPASDAGALISRCLDRLVRPDLHLFGAARNTFRVCGVFGFCLAAGVSMLLVVQRGLSPWVMTAITLAVVLSFLTLTMLTKILSGEERLVYYHQEIAAVAVAALLLRLWRQPVAAYLDITVLGVGLLLVCGRIGCLMVGCCHGRPHGWGVRYTPLHANAGFTPCYVGVRLLPVQALEAAWVLAVAAIGVVLVWQGARPGYASAWYIAAQGVGRFAIEFLRGDADRRYLWGFSEAQWTSTLLLGALGLASASSRLPFSWWYAAAGAALPLTMIGVALARRLRTVPMHRLLHARHLLEIAQFLWRVTALDAPADRTIAIGRTALGIQLSASLQGQPESGIRQYAISRPGDPLDEPSARALAVLITQLTVHRDPMPGGVTELIRGQRGVFHVVIRQPAVKQRSLEKVPNAS